MDITFTRQLVYSANLKKSSACTLGWALTNYLFAVINCQLSWEEQHMVTLPAWPVRCLPAWGGWLSWGLVWREGRRSGQEHQVRSRRWRGQVVRSRSSRIGAGDYGTGEIFQGAEAGEGKCTGNDSQTCFYTSVSDCGKLCRSSTLLPGNMTGKWRTLWK